ncbi:hypothetical protein [Candidatus Albibeggiatoa sp. nov. BB20]|uniref:hypothetical protein n=1 Tax=Candidatus Albibeggiatoa sp. nov. BB20 TaxID=3162723 RepID=UPI003365966B
MTLQQPLSNLQLELLKLFAHNVTEEQLQDIKEILAQYFAKQAIQEADRIWDEKDYTQDTMEQWLHE